MARIALTARRLRVVDGQVVGEPPNPVRPLDLIAKLAEYAVPKMTRVDVSHQGGSTAGVTNIQIEFVEAAPRRATPATIGELPPLPHSL